MTVKRPDTQQIQAVAKSLGIHLDDAKAASYLALLQPNFDAYDAVDAMPDYLPAVKYPRSAGTFPTGDENKYGAWYAKSTIKGAAGGKLARDLARRQQHQRQAFDAFGAGGIFAVRPAARQADAASCEPVEALLHQAALGGQAQLQHGAHSSSATRPGRMMPPTAGIASPCPSTRVSAS